MAYQAVFFDFDGTLADTAADVVDCLNRAFEANGFESHSTEEISALLGRPLADIVAGLLPERTPGQLVVEAIPVMETYKSLYADSPKSNTKLFSGMRALVDWLLASGITVVIHSNKPATALEETVDMLLPNRKLHVLGNMAGRPPKPCADAVVRELQSLGISPEHAAYIGDTQVDLDTAANAGLDCFIVSWGQGGSRLAETCGSAYYCRTVEQLREAVT